MKIGKKIHLYSVRNFVWLNGNGEEIRLPVENPGSLERRENFRMENKFFIFFLFSLLFISFLFFFISFSR